MAGTKEDPHIIIIKDGVTDGVQSTHQPFEVVYKNNGILYPAPPELALTWEYMIGIRLARLLRLPRSGPNQDWYKLARLPDRYALCLNLEVKFDGTLRPDAYLFGPPLTCRGKEYRSGPSVAHHLWWLLVAGDGPDELRVANGRQYRSCPCFVCTGRQSMSELAQELGLTDCYNFSAGKGQHAGGGGGGGRGRKGDKVKAVARPIAGRWPSPPPSYLGPFASEARDRDLRSGAGRHRQSELVWVKLNRALAHPSGDSSFDLTHWPAVVLERREKVTGGELVSDFPREPGKAAKLAPIQTRPVYEVQLLALDDVLVVDEVNVVAWHGLVPSAINFDDLQDEASVSLDRFKMIVAAEATAQMKMRAWFGSLGCTEDETV